MAIIDDKVAEIRAAVYGRDIRETIASGIETMNTELEYTTERQGALEGQFGSLIVNAGESNAEIVVGRTHSSSGVTFDQIGHRLDAMQVHTPLLLEAISRLGRGVNREGMLLFIDDDGMNGVLTKLKPKFLAKGIPCNVSLVANSQVVSDASKRADMLELQNVYGWEVIGHTMEHKTFPEMTQAQLEADCKNYLELMTAYGFNVKSIAYPQGYAYTSDYPADPTSSFKVISKYFNAGFDTNSVHNAQDGFNNYLIHRFKLGSMMSENPTLASLGISGGSGAIDTLAEFSALIDEAIASKRLLVFMTHCDYSGGSDQTLIEQVIDYAVSSGIKIGTVQDALRMHGNVIQMGNVYPAALEKFWALQADGTINSMRYHNVHRGDLLSVDINTLPSAFPIGETVKYIPSPSSAYPTAYGGVLVTKKPSSAFDYIKEEWWPTNDERPYIRRATSLTAWGTFKQGLNTDDKYLYKPSTNGIAENNTPAEIANTGITTCLVTGWTLGNGIISHQALSTNSSYYDYQRQIFYKAGGGVYTRYWSGGTTGSWGPWMAMTPISGTTANRPTYLGTGQNYFDTTLGKPVWLKTGAMEKDTLTLTSGAGTTSGNITITLNGVDFPVAVSLGDTIAQVDAKIRATAFSGWLLSGVAGSGVIVFTKINSGVCTAPAFTDTGTTGTAGTFARTTSGVANVWVDATGATV